jgi:hypothetical protein
MKNKKMKKSLASEIIAPQIKIIPFKKNSKSKELKNVSDYVLSVASERDTSTTRRDVAGSIIRTDRFKNIDDGVLPFRYSSSTYGNNKSLLDVRDCVILCQKAYYNIAVYRNIIDLMTEFSIGELYYRGGSSKSKDFFKALFDKINIWELQDKFFREYFRSGNVFVYRFDATLEKSDVARITQVFGSTDDIQNMDVDNMQIPARYVILNPADIHMVGTANFGFGIYYKLLTAFELAKLKNPQTEEDKLVFESFSPEIQRQIMSGIQSVLVPLDIKKVQMIFYKKQDYEPFSIPMGYPVLEDINFKLELKKIDMAICRTMQQIVLLVTTGAKPENGGINPMNILALQKILANPSVSHTLVADYTTKAEFIIPDIGELLNPQKYEIVNEDINTGLNNVFAGDEKFANQAQKVKIFTSRLDHAREAFLNNFLVPEIKRISQSLGFKNYPTPYFKLGSLDDDINLSRIFARLIEMGILTPEQGLEAIKTNTLPEPDTMVAAQKQYKQQRDEGLYLPLLNQPSPDSADGDSGGPTNSGNIGGRPTGTSSKQTTKSVSPIGTSKASEIKFSFKKIVENMLIAQKIEEDVIKNLKSLHNIKKLNKLQKSIANDITNTIVANEEPKDWHSKVEEYCKKPIDKNSERVTNILKLDEEHNLNDYYLASILYASQKEIETKEEVK